MQKLHGLSISEIEARYVALVTQNGQLDLKIQLCFALDHLVIWESQAGRAQSADSHALLIKSWTSSVVIIDIVE